MTPEHRPASTLALRSPIAMLLAFGPVACQPDDGRVVTIIGDRAVVTFERALCRGNIALIEETIDHVEESLDVQVETPIEMALWSHYVNVAAHCSEGPTGVLHQR